MKNYFSFNIPRNNKISDNKDVKNNIAINKYFSLENQAPNYQNDSARKLKKHNSSNFNEINIFPPNNLKGEQRSLENKNKSSPKANKKTNNLNEDEDEVKIVDVPLNFDYSYHSKSDIENIIKRNKNRNKSTNSNKINRVNPKEISSKNKNHVLSFDDKKRNIDFKGKTENIFYPKYNSLKYNQFEDEIIEKKDKKDCYFNDTQNINKIKVNTSSLFRQI